MRVHSMECVQRCSQLFLAIPQAACQVYSVRDSRFTPLKIFDISNEEALLLLVV